MIRSELQPQRWFAHTVACSLLSIGGTEILPAEVSRLVLFACMACRTCLVPAELHRCEIGGRSRCSPLDVRHFYWTLALVRRSSHEFMSGLPHQDSYIEAAAAVRHPLQPVPEPGPFLFHLGYVSQCGSVPARDTCAIECLADTNTSSYLVFCCSCCVFVRIAYLTIAYHVVGYGGGSVDSAPTPVKIRTKFDRCLAFVTLLLSLSLPCFMQP